MADPNPPNSLIAGRYAVDPNRRLLDAGGGLPAFAVTDRKSGDTRLVAIAVGRHASPRLNCLTALDRPIDNLMVPVGHGPGLRAGGGQTYYVICNAMLGLPVSKALEPWPENALIEYVLRPAAQVLTALQEAGLTHRAIRPDNVFFTTRNQPVTLGAAWAAPPGMHQPAVFESPFNALCHPAGRGEGSITDDVYALGVLLVTMATGRVPMADLDAATIIRRKLDLGSFAAVIGGANLPLFLADLLKGMLADDPEHRSQPRLLMDPTAARARRIAARPPRRSQRPLMLSDMAVFDARMLAYALTIDEKKSVQALRSGLVSQWLRRGLTDSGLATAVEELVRVRSANVAAATDADSRLLMHAISAIEPRMPLCWREVAFWPDAMGAMIAEGFRAEPKFVTLIDEVTRNDIFSVWDTTESRGGKNDVLSSTLEGRQLRSFLQKGGDSALLRMFYHLNPLLPCAIQAMAESWILALPDLMRFLEKTAVGGPAVALLDPHVLAFIAVRGDQHFESSVNMVVSTRDPKLFLTRQLTLLRDLQQRYLAQPLPAMAAWVAAQLRPQLDTWRNQHKRAEMLERLEALVKAGFIGRLLALVEDQKARNEDAAGADRAAALIAAIDSDLAILARAGETRRTVTARFGREMAAAIGMTALILMSLIAAVG